MDEDPDDDKPRDDADDTAGDGGGEEDKSEEPHKKKEETEKKKTEKEEEEATTSTEISRGSGRGGHFPRHRHHHHTTTAATTTRIPAHAHGTGHAHRTASAPSETTTTTTTENTTIRPVSRGRVQGRSSGSAGGTARTNQSLSPVQQAPRSTRGRGRVGISSGGGGRHHHHGGTVSLSPHRRVGHIAGRPTTSTFNAPLSDDSLMDDDNDDDDDNGFSPTGLMSQYTAAIQEGQQEKQQTSGTGSKTGSDTAETTSAASPPPVTLAQKSSTFWGMKDDYEDYEDKIEQTETSARREAHTRSRSPNARRGRSPMSTTGRRMAGSGPAAATTSGTAASSGTAGTMQSGNATTKRKEKTTGDVFSQKERFEHVDQSINLMDAGSYDKNAPDSPTGSTTSSIRSSRQRYQGKATTTRRFGGPSVGGSSENRSTRRKQSIFRTISTEFSEISLRKSIRGFGRTISGKGIGIMNMNFDDSDTIREEVLDELDDDDDDETGGISLWACMQCLCFFSLLVVIVLLMTGVIPLPQQWGGGSGGGNSGGGGFSIPGTTSTEKSGEDLLHSSSDNSGQAEQGSNSVSPKQLRSNAPTPATTTFVHDDERWDSLLSLIMKNQLSSDDDLKNPNSAAYKALRWLCDIDPAQVGNTEAGVRHLRAQAEDWEIMERYSMAVFFYSTHMSTGLTAMSLENQDQGSNEAAAADIIDVSRDESLEAALLNSQDLLQNSGSSSSLWEQELSGWHHKSGWMKQEHVCEWYGVQCHRSGHVSEIRLVSNKLIGEIPSELRALSGIQHLNLSNNYLRHRLPDVLWDPATWPELRSLALSNNDLSGQLPDSVGGFSQLQNLTLAGNMFSGELPSSIADLTNLAVLDVQDNKFTGFIHDTSPIPNLCVLRLGQNKLEGRFPFSLTQNRNLVELRLDENVLSGTLPPELDSLHKLESLYVAANNFTGPIPDIFSRLHKLQVLELQRNLLGQYHDEEDQQAQLPTSLGELTNLRIFKISTNRIHADIPKEWWKMTSLERFHLYDNDFFGSINDGIGSFSNLRDLQVHDTFMSGTIPSQLGQCQNLETLSTYNCQFEGNIPDVLCDLHISSVANGNSTDKLDDTPSGSTMTAKSVGGHKNRNVPNNNDDAKNQRLSFFAADCQSSVTCKCCDRCY